MQMITHLVLLARTVSALRPAPISVVCPRQLTYVRPKQPQAHGPEHHHHQQTIHRQTRERKLVLSARGWLSLVDVLPSRRYGLFDDRPSGVNGLHVKRGLGVAALVV